MPYSGASDSGLPKNVKEMPTKKRRQWVSVFNSAIDKYGDEGRAFKIANGVMKNKDLDSGLVQVGDQPDADTVTITDNDDDTLVVYLIDENDEVEELELDNKAGASDKPSKKSLWTQFIDTVSSVLPTSHDPRPQPLFMFTKQADGRTRFFANPTNAFIDKEHEIFSSEAHVEFVEWANENQTYPELWLWHVPGSRIGEVDWLDTDGLIISASGLIDEDKVDIVERVAAKAGGIGMSHGFVARFKGSIATKYRSFEYSLLPQKHAANSWTDFSTLEVPSMPFSQARKDWLTKEAGVDAAVIASWEANADALTNQLKSLGIDWKSEPEAEIEDAQPINDVAKGVASEVQNEGIKALTSQISALTKAISDGFSSIDARVKTIEAGTDAAVAAAIAPRTNAGTTAAYKASEADDNAPTGDAVVAAAKKDTDWFSGVIANTRSSLANGLNPGAN